MTEPRTGPAQPADRLHLLPRHREKLAALLLQHLPGVEVWAYGSRVNGQSHDGSDLDLVLRGPDLQEIPTGCLADFREALRESTIPFLVEARDWAHLPERFQREIEREYVVVAGTEERGGMGEWQETVYGPIRSAFADSRLADLCEPTAGIQTGPFGSQLHQKDYVAAGTPIITVEHLGENCILHAALPYVSEQDRTRLSKYTLQEGDIVFSRVGSVDRRGLVRKEEEGWLFSGRCLRIRPNPNKIDAGFLSYFFGLPAFKNHIRSIAVGSTMPSLNTQLLSDICIHYPADIEEQRAIAHILGTLDDKIELNRRMNVTLDDMARTLFTSWFVHFDPVHAKAALTQRASPGGSVWPVARAYLDRLDAATAAVFPDRFVDSELGPIPAGWTVKPLDEIAVFRNGLALQQYRPQQDEDRLPVVKIAQLRSGTADSGEWATAKLAPDCVIDDGDIIFSWSGSLLVQVWYGGRAALNQHLFKVTSPRFPQWFLLHCLRGHLAAFQAIAAGKATTMGHIKRQHLSEALCAVPEERLLMAANGLLSAIFEKNISVAVQSRTLAALRDTLLPKLISGDIRVRDAGEQVERLA